MSSKAPVQGIGRLRYYGAYTVMFLVLSCIVFIIPFRVADSSFVWVPDAMGQHYNALVYIGEWLRSIAGSIAAGNPEVKLWEFGFGYGADVWTNLQFYVIADPLTLLSAFVPPKYTEYLYDFLALFRVYLAGITFSAYCFKMKAPDWRGVLGGAVVYTFCGYVLLRAIMHPFFINAMVLLPLYCISVERIFQKQGAALFVLTVFLSAIANFYLFYMLVVFVVVYVLARYFMLTPRASFGSFVRCVGTFLAYGVLGAAMAAAVLLPLLHLFFGASRSGIEHLNDPLYSARYYQNLLTSFAASPTATNSAILGFSAPVLLAASALFGSAKRHRVLKIAFVGFTLLLLVPIAGRALNGFSYVSNRWCWAYAFMVAFVVVWMWPEMLAMARRQKVVSIAGLGVYLIAVVVIQPKGNMESALVSVAIAAIALAAIFLAEGGEGIGRARASSSWLLVGMFAVGVVANAYFLFSPDYRDFVSEFVESGTLWKLESNTTLKDAKSRIEEDGVFSRVEQDKFQVKNTGNLIGVSSTQFYWSLANGDVSRYHKALGVGSGQADFNFENLEERAYLDALACVRYYYSGTNPAPYGFDEAGTVTTLDRFGNKKEFRVFENQSPLQIGYTYDSCITEGEWEKLDFSARQEALLQAVLVEEVPTGLFAVEYSDIDSQIAPIDFAVECEAGVLYDGGGTFSVAKKGAEATLHFAGLPNSETYLCVQDLSVQWCSLFDYYHDEDDSFLSPEEFEELGKDERTEIEEDSRNYNNWEKTRFDMVVRGEESEKLLRYVTPYERYNAGWTDYLVNVGYSEAAQEEITITFPDTGEYHFGDFQVMCLPMDNYDALIQERSANVLENVVFGNNVVEGNISLGEPKVLCLSLPYSPGWSIYVDGEEAPAFQANGMFTGVALGAGEHHVEARYFTPLLAQGLAISATAWLLFAVLLIVQRRRFQSRARAFVMGNAGATEKPLEAKE